MLINSSTASSKGTSLQPPDNILVSPTFPLTSLPPEIQNMIWAWAAHEPHDIRIKMDTNSSNSSKYQCSVIISPILHTCFNSRLVALRIFSKIPLDLHTETPRYVYINPQADEIYFDAWNCLNRGVSHRIMEFVDRSEGALKIHHLSLAYEVEGSRGLMNFNNRHFAFLSCVMRSPTLKSISFDVTMKYLCKTNIIEASSLVDVVYNADFFRDKLYWGIKAIKFWHAKVDPDSISGVKDMDIDFNKLYPIDHIIIRSRFVNTGGYYSRKYLRRRTKHSQ